VPITARFASLAPGSTSGPLASLGPRFDTRPAPS